MSISHHWALRVGLCGFKGLCGLPRSIENVAHIFGGTGNLANPIPHRGRKAYKGVPEPANYRPNEPYQEEAWMAQNHSTHSG